MKKILFFIFIFSSVWVNAQVATSYTFSQENGTYTPLIAASGTTPADPFPMIWDDMAYTGYTLPFPFYYNGTVHPAGTIIGLDTDSWICFAPTTMTGPFFAGSWISSVNSSGAYLWGTANNNGFAGFNMDVMHQEFDNITGNITAGNRVVSGISGAEFTNLRIGTRLVSSEIPDGTVITAIGANNFTMSANALSTGSDVSITPASSIFALTRGTAPNREFVIQWTQVKKYYASDFDNISFQMILSESGGVSVLQKLKVVYGPISTISAIDVKVQVGLRGNSNLDYNARKSTTGDWLNTVPATSPTNGVIFNNMNEPPVGLTFIWTPACNSLGSTGSLTGTVSVCPNASYTYTMPPVAGATYYKWSYTGTGAVFNDITTSPTNDIQFLATATSGQLLATPYNPCTPGDIAAINITIKSVIQASINYPGAGVYCSSDPAKNVTLSGPGAGTYTASPAGLSINPANGQIIPATSTPGIYVVSYNYTNNGCNAESTDSITIKPIINAIATAGPARICNGGSVQLQATSNALYTVAAATYSVMTPSGSPTVIWNGNTDEAISSAITLPFSFSFFGQLVSQLYVSTNGYIKFGNVGTFSNTPQFIPDKNDPNNIIALAWANLAVDPAYNPGSTVRYFTNGVSPNRVFVIDYINLRFSGSGPGQNITGQIRLFENDKHIEIHASQIKDNNTGILKTMGIENNTGLGAFAPPGRNIGNWNITSPEAWKFIPSTVSYVWSPAAGLSNPNIENPVITSLTTSATYTVQVTDDASGCGGSNSITIPFYNATITNTAGAEKCGFGTLTLTASASSGALISWYDAITGGNLVGLGETYTTPTISSATTYYATAEADQAGQVTLGNGNTIGQGYESPLFHVFGGQQSQYLIKASELLNAGLRSGNITELSFYIPVLSNESYTGFSISLAGTNVPDMSGGLQNPVFTNVFLQPVYNPVQGKNSFTFSTPFAWDGIQNLLIKICWSNNNSGGITNYVLVDATAYLSCAYYVGNDLTATDMCSQTTANGILSLRPQFSITGNMSACRSTPVAVQATINPQPSELGLDPHSYIVCSGTPQALIIPGAKYITGTFHPIFTDNFETFPSPNFVASGAKIIPAANNTYYASGSQSVWLKYIDGATNLTSNNNAYVMQNNFDMSTYGAAQLSFSHICGLEDPVNAFDAGYVQYSNDGGLSWYNFEDSTYLGSGSLVTTVNGAPVTGVVFSSKSYPEWAAAFYSTSATPGTAPATDMWKQELIQIPAFAMTSQFKLRFVITNDAAVAYYGWLIDNLQIKAYSLAQAPVTWTPNGIGSGLFTDAAGTIPYFGTPAVTVYAQPSAPTTYTVQSSVSGACGVQDTAYVLIKPSNTWLGLNTVWTDPQNWCPDVPTPVSDILIPNGVDFYPVITNTVPTVHNITIQPLAELAIEEGAVFNVYGDFINAGTVSNDGTISLRGSQPQLFPGKTGNLAAMNILEIANTAGGVKLDTSVYVTGELKPTSGVLNLDNYDFTLKSLSYTTARVSALGTTANFMYGDGRFIVERYINAGRKWRFLSVPVVGDQTINQAWQEAAINTLDDPNPGYGTQVTSNINPLPPLFDFLSPGGPGMKHWDASIQGYRAETSTLVPIASDYGYMLYLRGNRLSNLTQTALTTTTLRSRGKLILRNKTIAFTGMLPEHFLSIGNPYASAINLKQVTRNNVAPFYYVWDPFLASSPSGGNYGLGAFQLYSLNTTTGDYEIFPGNGSYGPPNSVDNKIESGAAFFVKTVASGNASVSFTESSKTDSSRPVFRQEQVHKGLMVFLQTGDAAGDYFTLDGIKIDVDATFNNDIDEYDAQKMGNTGENIFILQHGRKLIVERREPYLLEDTIFIQNNNLKYRSYRLSIHIGDLVNPLISACLLDTYTLTETPLPGNEITDYDYIVNNAGSATPNRFIIIFKKQKRNPFMPTVITAKEKSTLHATVKMNDIIPKMSFNLFPNPVKDEKITLQIISSDTGEAQWQLYSPTGQLLMQQNLSLKAGEINYPLKLKSGLAAGHYQFMLSLPGGIMKTGILQVLR
ncbi:MAG: hypothetical protein IPL97_08280 [Niastella sp.]|nr:hypothetical protein [Niastella sp.]